MNLEKTQKKMQEIFDIVSSHLLRQNARSITPFGCAYRGADGLKCAIGVLIPDTQYNKTIEGVRANHQKLQIILIGALELYDYKESERAYIFDFLGSLQTTHDCFNPSSWPRELQILAMNNKLTLNPIGETNDGQS